MQWGRMRPAGRQFDMPALKPPLKEDSSEIGFPQLPAKL